MDDDRFIRIFGERRRRETFANRLHFRDAAIIAELKARLSGLAARDNRARDSGWTVDFSPVRTDEPTECSLFEAAIISPKEGERRFAVRVAREWVEIGDGLRESSVRGNGRNLAQALDNAFHHTIPRWPAGRVDPATIKRVDA